MATVAALALDMIMSLVTNAITGGVSGLAKLPYFQESEYGGNMNLLEGLRPIVWGSPVYIVFPGCCTSAT